MSEAEESGSQRMAEFKLATGIILMLINLGEVLTVNIMCQLRAHVFDGRGSKEAVIVLGRENISDQLPDELLVFYRNQ